MNTPTLDKMLEIKEGSQKIGEFLDWLHKQGKVSELPEGEE